jgi:Neprosin
VEGDKYYGAKATINVWEPKIEQSNEFSLSQLWILGGSFGQDLNSIEAGWQVIHISVFKSTFFFQRTFEYMFFL